MKHPYVLVFLIANALSLVFAWWVSRENPNTAPDDLMGGAFVAVIVIVLLALTDAFIAAASLVVWLVKG